MIAAKIAKIERRVAIEERERAKNKGKDRILRTKGEVGIGNLKGESEEEEEAETPCKSRD